MIKNLKRSIYLGSIVLAFSGIISCEKDFTDVGTNIIKNSNFSSSEIIVEINVSNAPVEKFRSDNLFSERGQYLLGVHNSSNYEKIEASIITQLGVNSSYQLIEETLAKGETIATTIDTVFIKIPYQSTLTSNTGDGPKYTLDSIVGNTSKEFSLNVFKLETYLSRLNQLEPSKGNIYYSNSTFLKGENLSADENFAFKPNENDTVVYIKRRTSKGLEYQKDTVKYSVTDNNIVPIPFVLIPLKEDLLKKYLLDGLGSSNFDSQEAFNNYFRGIVIEASGDDGALMSFDFTSSAPSLSPSLEIYYTNTVLKEGKVLRTLNKNHRYSFTGIRSNQFKMEDKIYPQNNVVQLQGAAGSEVVINLFGPDLNANGIADKLEELRAQNLLINNASITFYIDPKSIDATAVPSRLSMYKRGVDANGRALLSYIKDIATEGITYGGYLLIEEKEPSSYTFNITDYISDLVMEGDNYSPNLRLKVFNTTDVYASDSTFINNNWNPKVISIFNHLGDVEGKRKAQLKITYSKREN